jgi:hypothetical protein
MLQCSTLIPNSVQLCIRYIHPIDVSLHYKANPLIFLGRNTLIQIFVAIVKPSDD